MHRADVSMRHFGQDSNERITFAWIHLTRSTRKARQIHQTR